jgi:enoyl-CoA hydratase
MSLTGNFVDAATALRVGLANHVKPHEALLPFALELAAAIADADPAMVSAMRRDWDANWGAPIGDARRIHREHAITGGFGRNRGTEIAGHRETVLARSRVQRGS